ncbi:MAG: ATPase [Frankiales bacterium]|nr:ATPase [Frankiales bacterium]
MPVDVLTRITIHRPPDVVSAFAADPSNAPDWYANIDAVEWLTPSPVGVGSRMAFQARFLGRRLSYTYEVVDYVAGVRLTMRTSQGPFSMQTTYEWHDQGDGSTTMTLRNQGEPSGFAAVTGQAMAVAMRRANQKDLSRLKDLLETRDGPATPDR